MAFKALICPQCGANLELDDSREIGYCEYCGSKVLIREVTEVRHLYDNTGVLANLKTLADREYQAGNYRDALEHYKKALECDANEPVCIFRKAVCSIMLSSEERVLKEACSDIRLAKKILVMDGREELKEQMEHDLVLIYKEYSAEYDPSPKYFPSRDFCLDHIEACIRILTVAEALNELVENGKDKEEFLRGAIELCDKKVYSGLRYGDVNQPVALTPPAELVNRITGIRKKFAEEYNHLPERLAQLNYYKSEVDRLTEEVSKRKKALDQLAARKIKPEAGRFYREYTGVKVYVISLIIASGVFGIWLPTFIDIIHRSPVNRNPETIMAYVITLMVPFAVAIAVAVTIVRNKRTKFYASLNPVPEETEYDRLYNAKIDYYKKVVELQEASTQYSKLLSEQK